LVVNEIIKLCVAAVFIVIVVITDCRTYKIRNKHVVLFSIAGLLLNSATSGINGLCDSVYGLLIPLALFPLFSLKMLGAGDIKAFCAIGGVVGFRMSVYTMLLSFIAGGVIALGFMLFRKNAAQRMRRLGLYLKQCFLFRTLLPYDDFADEGGKFRFSFGIAAGFALAVLERFVKF
jgi:prepilin peptidase CpaA